MNWKRWVVFSCLYLASLSTNAVTPMLAADLNAAIFLYSDGSVWGTGFSGATSPVRVFQLPNVVAVAAGDRNYFALLADGTVSAMGVNRNGQLADGTTQGRSQVQSIPGLSGVKAVVASQAHVLALKQDGTVWAWGNNEFGQLGDGTATSRYVPTQVAGLSNITRIAASFRSSLALRADGTVWMWGAAYRAAAGDGSMLFSFDPASNHLVPTQVQIDNAIAIAGGEGVPSLALRADGTVWVWGQGANGSNGFADGRESVIPEQIPGLDQIVAIESRGQWNAFALKADGTVWAWGYNNRGQLGVSGPVSLAIPTKVPGLSNIVALSSAWEYSIAMDRDGNVFSWGLNSNGQLGDGTLQNRAEPRLVLGPGGGGSTLNLLENAPATYNSVPSAQIGLDASSGHAPLAVTASALNATDPDGTIAGYEWITSDGQQAPEGPSASFAFSQPGTYQISLLVTDDKGGSSFSRKEVVVMPVAVSVAATPKVGIGFSTIALANDGRILLWGSRPVSYGQTYQQWTPSLPFDTGITGAVDIAISLSGGHALLTDGSVLGWGNNYFGMPGAGHSELGFMEVTLLTDLPAVKALAAGPEHRLALTRDGRVYAWGYNAHGELGLGDNLNRFTPVEVTALGGDVVGIAAGFYYSVALKSDGTVWVWGTVTLALSGSQNYYSPTQVPGLTGITRIFSSYNNIFAQAADGTTWVTGGIQGMPVAGGIQHVAAFDGAVQFAGGFEHVIVLKPDGTVWTVGVKQAVALGFVDSGDVAGLRRVPGITDAIGVAAGGYNSAVLRRDGTVLTWGRNDYGQIGDGTYALRSTPVLVVNQAADGYLDLIPGIYFEEPPSVGVSFFAVVSGDVSSAKATVHTRSKFNASDVGKSGKVFVTATVPPGSLVAPQSGLKAQSALLARSSGANSPISRAATDPPVLIQLTSSGWQPVVNGQLIPYASGVLGDQLSAQSILENTDTTNLKGAEFCVGYGSSAEQMMAVGTMRVVATIPDPNATGAAAPSCIVTGAAASYGLAMAPGWNLLGNSLNQTLAVASLYGDPNSVITAWKWDAARMAWQFYTPLMDAAALQAYADSKGYAVLSTINPGDGYWVNAKAPPATGTQAGTPFIVTSTNLTKGWNLVATGNDITPTQFNANLKASILGKGATTLWAWDGEKANWYFYAPSLEEQGGTALSGYIAGKGYLDFTAANKKLGNGAGFWVNRP